MDREQRSQEAATARLRYWVERGDLGAVARLLQVGSEGERGGSEESEEEGEKAEEDEEETPVRVDWPDEHGDTPLHVAARLGHADLCSLLLRRGALVNARNRLGCTPLTLAAARADPRAVRVLLRHGGEPAAENHLGESPLHVASSAGLADVIVELAMTSSTKEGCDVNASTSSRGLAPLYLAVGSGSLSAVRALLELGAEVNQAVAAAAGQRKSGGVASPFFPAAEEERERRPNQEETVEKTELLFHCPAATTGDWPELQKDQDGDQGENVRQRVPEPQTSQWPGQPPAWKHHFDHPVGNRHRITQDNKGSRLVPADGVQRPEQQQQHGQCPVTAHLRHRPQQRHHPPHPSPPQRPDPRPFGLSHRPHPQRPSHLQHLIPQRAGVLLRPPPPLEPGEAGPRGPPERGRGGCHQSRQGPAQAQRQNGRDRQQQPSRKQDEHRPGASRARPSDWHGDIDHEGSKPEVESVDACPVAASCSDGMPFTSSPHMGRVKSRDDPDDISARGVDVNKNIQSCSHHPDSVTSCRCATSTEHALTGLQAAPSESTEMQEGSLQTMANLRQKDARKRRVTFPTSLHLSEWDLLKAELSEWDLLKAESQRRFREGFIASQKETVGEDHPHCTDGLLASLHHVSSIPIEDKESCCSSGQTHSPLSSMESPLSQDDFKFHSPRQGKQPYKESSPKQPETYLQTNVNGENSLAEGKEMQDTVLNLQGLPIAPPREDEHDLLSRSMEEPCSDAASDISLESCPEDGPASSSSSLFSNSRDVEPSQDPSSYAETTRLRLNCPGITPLHRACQLGLESVARVLLQAGACVNAQTESGESPLYYAAKYSSSMGCGETTGLIRLLLGAGAELDLRTVSGATALHAAALVGDALTASVLLAAGADVKARDRDGDLPLHKACQRVVAPEAQRLRTVRLLLSHGADVKAVNREGLTPLDVILLQKDRGLDPDIVRVLLTHGADPNKTLPTTGHHPLIWTLQEHLFNLAWALAEKGSNPNAPDEEGQTAMHLACLAGQHELFTFLWHKGGHPGTPNCYRAPPLRYAVQSGSEVMVARCLATGAGLYPPPQENASASSSSSSEVLPDLFARHVFVLGRFRDAFTSPDSLSVLLRFPSPFIVAFSTARPDLLKQLALAGAVSSSEVAALKGMCERGLVDAGTRAEEAQCMRLVLDLGGRPPSLQLLCAWTISRRLGCRPDRKLRAHQLGLPSMLSEFVLMPS